MFNNLYHKNLTSDPFEGVVTQKYDAKPLNILQKKKKKKKEKKFAIFCY